MATIQVNAGGNLQAALNVAAPGDTIRVEPSATFAAVQWPNKAGTAPITLRTNAADANLPDENTRIDPSKAGYLPIIQSENSDPAFTTAAQAHNIILMGINFKSPPAGQNDVITLGAGDGTQTSLAGVPQNIILDRCIVQGNDATKRGIALNSYNTTIKNSYIYAIRKPGQDSQAIGSWNGPGQFVIHNNYLEAAGENVMFGGADPAISGLVPSDITITSNYLFKPLSWMADSGFNVKNLFELKNAKRVLIQGNVFENSWVDAQIGWGVVFSLRDQDGTDPLATVQDVTFIYNIIKNTVRPFGLLGLDDRPGIASVQGTNLVIKHVLIIGSASVGIDSTFGYQPTTIEHITAPLITDKILSFDSGPMPPQMFVFQNNVVQGGAFGITGSGATSVGKPSLDDMAPQSTFDHNVIGQDGSVPFPSGNSIVSTAVLASRFDANYRYLGPEVPTEGVMGCDIDALMQHIPWFFSPVVPSVPPPDPGVPPPPPPVIPPPTVDPPPPNPDPAPEPGVGVTDGFLLLEDGSYLLLEADESTNLITSIVVNI